MYFELFYFLVTTSENNVKKEGASLKSKTKAAFEEEEEGEVSENETDFEPSSSEETTDGETSGEESEEEVLIAKKKEASLKRKRAAKTPKTPKTASAPKKKKIEGVEVEKTKPIKNGRGKKPAAVEGATDVDESETRNLKEGEENEYNNRKKVSKEKAMPLFDSGKVDINLHTEDPTNIIPRTVQVSKGLKISCKMISGAQMFSGKITYPDWPGLVIHKKIKDGKVFEFNLNLLDAPKIITALQYIIKENPTFFNSIQKE